MTDEQVNKILKRIYSVSTDEGIVCLHLDQNNYSSTTVINMYNALKKHVKIPVVILNKNMEINNIKDKEMEQLIILWQKNKTLRYRNKSN